MKCLRSFYKFSTKVVKMDINAIISGDVCKTKDNMNNMLLFYYPISKKHFEDSGEGSDSNCEEICIDAVASPEEHMTQCNLLTGNTTCSTRRSLKMSKFAKKRKNSLKK